MSRTRLFHWELPLTLTLLERTFVTYYATRYGKDFREIVRGMLRKYVESDTNFDPDAYLRMVKNKMVPMMDEEDEELQKEVVAQAKKYVERRKKGSGKKKGK